MERLHLLCKALEDNVMADELDVSMIKCIAVHIASTTKQLLERGLVAPIRDKAVDYDIDLVFEGLCVARFDYIFKNLAQHGGHLNKLFIEVATPYFEAGVFGIHTLRNNNDSHDADIDMTNGIADASKLNSTKRIPRRALKKNLQVPLKYIARFQTRRYSYKHRVRRQERKQGIVKQKLF